MTQKTKKKTSKKKEGDQQIRIPRTAGITLAIKHLNQIDDPKQKKKQFNKIIDRVLLRYVEDGYRLNGRTMSIDEVSSYLDIPVTRVIKESTRVIRTMSTIGDGEDGLQDLYRALLSLGLRNSLADRGRITKQADMLEADQGGTYTPFLTSALNQTHKNLMESNKPLMELIKILTPSDPAVVINNQNQQNQGQFLGTNEAVKLIDSKRTQTLLESPEQKALMAKKYLQEGNIPEIVATKQQGYSAGGESLIKQKPKPSKVPKHETRREDDGEIIDI